MEPYKRQAYVGQSAFAHKGGLHVAAVQKNRETYEHIDPERVGNHQRVLVSDLAGRSRAFRLAPPPDVDRAARAAAAHGHAGGGATVLAPMPGTVLALHVVTGDAVNAGDPIATLEAMKMEHVVAAPIAGRLAEMLVSPADQVVRGQPLGTIEP